MIACFVWSSARIASAEDAPVLDVASVRDKTPPGALVRVFEDPTRQVTFDQVRAKPFVRPASEQLAFGFTRSAVWLVLHADNLSPRPHSWLLHLDYPHLDEVTLYVVHADSRVQSFETGEFGASLCPA